MNNRIYLGDSVYAIWDGYSIIIIYDNGYGPKNSILLQPEVVANLTTFAKQCYMDEFNKFLNGRNETIETETIETDKFRSYYTRKG